MTHQEAIQFFSRQIERCVNGLNVAHASQNWHLAAMNYRQLFKCHLMCGLAEWRLQRNPTPRLNSAISAISEGLDTLHSWSTQDSAAENLPIERAALLSCLTGQRFVLSDMGSINLVPDRRLDLMLAGSDSSGYNPDDLIAKLLKSKRTLLAGETYRNYFALLNSGSDHAKGNALIMIGEGLFERRKKDSYFSGSDQTEGGGQENQLVVDYRLAAAIKQAGVHSNSPHAWIW